MGGELVEDKPTLLRAPIQSSNHSSTVDPSSAATSHKKLYTEVNTWDGMRYSKYPEAD